jgi:hypothetical protein
VQGTARRIPPVGTRNTPLYRSAVVGLVTGIIGWAVLNGGLKQLKEISLVPHKTLQSLERDAKMAKEKLS